MLKVVNFINVTMTLFLVGVLGLITSKRNIILILMSIEIILLYVGFSLITYASFLDDMLGQVFFLLVLTVAAAESAIGLAIIVLCYRSKQNILVDSSHLLRG
jgi:NADH-quinone oxidoreductase subunit K